MPRLSEEKARENLSQWFPNFDFSSFQYLGTVTTEKSKYFDENGVEHWDSYRNLQIRYKQSLKPTQPKPKDSVRFFVETTRAKRDVLKVLAEISNQTVSELIFNAVWQNIAHYIDVQTRYTNGVDDEIEILEQKALEAFFGTGTGK